MNPEQIETPFFLKAGERTKKFTLTLVINGTGTNYLGDIVLFKEPLK